MHSAHLEIVTMSGTAIPEDCRETESLILRALVRKLVAKGVLSPEDVRSLLYDAVQGLDIVVTADSTRKAANEIIVERD
jgi:hypothetical protein